MVITNVKYGFVAGAGLIVTPAILSSITLAPCGTNRKFVFIGKRSNVLELMDGLSLGVVCTSAPFAQNKQGVIAVQVCSSKKINFSWDPFNIYRDLIITLKVFNEHQDIPYTPSCCFPISGCVMTVPSGTTLKQLSDLLKRRLYVLSHQWQQTTSKRVTDVDSDVLLAPGYGDHSSPPTYQAIFDHEGEQRWSQYRQLPTYESCNTSPPLYTRQPQPI
ncbi:unnamed protein product [Umbelopsis sp. WA50703]